MGAQGAAHVRAAPRQRTPAGEPTEAAAGSGLESLAMPVQPLDLASTGTGSA
jgi:hypothetical protein